MDGDLGTFITLHRKITEWEWYTDGNTFRLFVHLLIKANHKETKWRGETVQRGQVLTGLPRLSEETGISIQGIRTSIKRLKSTGEITDKVTNKYRVITVCNYDTYQTKKDESDSQSNRQANSQTTVKQQSTNSQLTTSNNLNNLKEEEKTPKSEPSGRSLPKTFLDSPFREEAYNFADWFSTEWKPEEVPFKRDDWAQVYDLLRRKDGYTKQQIKNAVKFGRTDPFWSKNFRSPLKLRNKNQDGEAYISIFLRGSDENGPGQGAAYEYKPLN